jgi:hypothetical protein
LLLRALVLAATDETPIADGRPRHVTDIEALIRGWAPQSRATHA